MAVLEPKMQSDLLNVTCIILALPLLLHSNLVDNGTLPVLTLNFWPEKRCCPPQIRIRKLQNNHIEPHCYDVPRKEAAKSLKEEPHP
ncbi:hypothetical protein BJV77DRAFT_991718 [Russula vinacea]|nr:hypothetical protein BJV77DRAFT_991718 [Russula vinacea]